MNSAPAPSIMSVARLRSSSKLISAPRNSNPILYYLCLFSRLAIKASLASLQFAIRNPKSLISSPYSMPYALCLHQPSNLISHISHPKSPYALHREPCAFPQSAIILPQSFSDFRTATKACWGIITEPTIFMRFLPFFCFSRSLRLRVTSPP